MISREQTRAARAMLGWSQKDLGDHSGVSVQTIKLFETGRIDSTPDTLGMIQASFETAGIEFVSGSGVRFREDLLTVFEKKSEDENVFLYLLDDIYYTLREKGGEVLWSFVDDSVSPPEVLAKEKLIRDSGITYRSLVRHDNGTYLYPREEYRHLPEGFFTANPTIVYGDKFALVVNAPDEWRAEKVIIIKDPGVSWIMTLQFEMLWHLCGPIKGDVIPRAKS